MKKPGIAWLFSFKARRRLTDSGLNEAADAAFGAWVCG
jgi:hypothetical protein